MRCTLQPLPAQPSELPSAANFFLEQGPNQRVSWQPGQGLFAKVSRVKRPENHRKPKASLLPQEDVGLTKAALGREEDSSDDEEELMAHPWPRHQLWHSEDSAIDVCIAGACCATVQL